MFGAGILSRHWWLLVTKLRLRLCIAGLLFCSADVASALDSRAANTSLMVPEEPAVYEYEIAAAYPDLNFTRPVVLVSPPADTNRLFVVEQPGTIYVITNLAAPTKTLFLDLTSVVRSIGNEEGLLGMAFHPGWHTNRYFFVFYTTTTTTPDGSGRHDRLSRFEIDPTNPNAAQVETELPVISQLDQASNHNGGDLHFGPDGYLYISTGDEGGGGDQFNNSRVINKDFFSAILRIDVDKRAGSLPPNPHPAIHTDAQGDAIYAIPPDNPFIDVTAFNGQAIDPDTVRTEFWAVGLRNPWRTRFDPATGILYCADVGQNQYEEVNIITPGADFGWNYKEGLHDYGSGIPANTVEESDLTAPIVAYPHSNGPSIPGGVAQGASITGGVVYRGDHIPQLKGHYVFGDFVSGRIFALRYDSDTGQAQGFRQLTSASQPAAFGVDPSNGDVLIAQLSGTLRRLIVSEEPVAGAPAPATLSGTGAFSDLNTLTPEPGIVPYELNVPFWSDHAVKRRWFSIPDLGDKMTFSATENWSFPPGMVWIKHFDLELTNGIPASRRRLETRFLVKNADGIHGFTYRWNDAQTEAELVAEGGGDELFTIHEPDGSVLREQNWRYPSRTECLQCHTEVGGFALGFQTSQINRVFDYGSGPVNQIVTLENVGYLDNSPPNPGTLTTLASAEDESASLEHRVRSFLQANCAQCHQPGGTALGSWDARITTSLENAGLIDGMLADDGGDPDNRVIAPGDAGHSMLLQRIAIRGVGQMPPLASTEVDQDAVDLLSAWITSLGSEEPKLPVITWPDQAAIVYGTPLDETQLNAVADVTGTFTYVPAEGTVLSAGMAQMLTVAFTPDDLVNYTTAQASVQIDVLPAPLVITADDKIRMYGRSNPPLTASYDGFVNEDGAADLDTPVVLDTPASAGSSVGSYPVTVAGASDANYRISFVEGTLSVTPAPLVITAEDKNRVHGAPNPPLTASYSGFVNSEIAANLDAPVVLSTPATEDSPVGEYPITAGQASDLNYLISFVEGTLTVEPNARITSVTLLGDGRVRVEFTGLAGRLYRIESSMDLVSWETLMTVEAGTDGTASFIDTTAPESVEREFYRIAWP